tara:strand:+ start:299 stop:928 length:630 start_codon:yes stop_codon:yes gene_type:complete
MLQNKYLFNQSSVSLEIIGLPDYSNNENKDQISIISQWKLSIIDQPLIEGNVDHLRLIMDAFYSYSNYLINDEIPLYQSKLIDIKAENFFTHKVLLKSSKQNVEPLYLNVGNSVLSDIISCFDQLNSSKKVRKIKLNQPTKLSKTSNLSFYKKDKFINFILPPLISICSLFIISSAFIYVYKLGEEKDNNALTHTKKIANSVKSINTII